MSNQPPTDAERRLYDSVLDTLAAKGLLPFPTAIEVVHFIGKELQGINANERRTSISRLRNKATKFRAMESPIGETYAVLIDALCASWEDFTPRE